jgi:hypothetical protein
MNVKTILGKPTFIPGKFLGYVLWKQSDGFHLRWTVKGKKRQSFQGKVKCYDKVKVIKVHRIENTYKVNETQKNTIEWDTVLDSELDGFDFLTPGDFEVELRIKNKKIKPKMIFLGPEMEGPKDNPFKIIQPPSELILGDESEIIDTETKLEEEEKKLSLKAPEPAYEPESIKESEQLIEQRLEEASTYEPAPIPTPAPEYAESAELIVATITDEEPTEESDTMIPPSVETKIIAMEESVPEVETNKVTISETVPESDIDPEKRIYEWLTQLLNYRDFGLKDEPKLVVIDESLPEKTPEISVETSIKPQIEEIFPLITEVPEESKSHQVSETIPESESLEDESKSISIYESLPENKPEEIMEPIIKPEIEEESTLSSRPIEKTEIQQPSEPILVDVSKQEDDMEARIFAWLAQLLKYRKFKTE